MAGPGKPGRPRKTDKPPSDEEQHSFPGMEPPETEEAPMTREQSAIEEIERMVASLEGTGAKVRIYYRSHDEVGEPQLVETMNLEDFDLDWLARELGGGLYRLQFLTRENKHVKRVQHRVHKSVEGERWKRKNRAELPASPGMPPDLDALRHQYDKSEDRQLQFLTMIMNQQQQAMQQQMQLMIEIMKNNKPTDQSPVVSALVPALSAAIRTNSGDSQMGGLVKQLEQFNELKTLLRDDDGKERERSLMDYIAEMVGKGAEAFIAAKTGKPIQAAAEPEQLPSAEQTQQGKINEVIEKIRKFKGTLLRQARKRANPQKVAEVIVDSSETLELQVLCAIIQQPTAQWLQALFPDEPEFAKHEAWCEALAHSVIEQSAELLGYYPLKEAEGGEGGEPPQGGNSEPKEGEGGEFNNSQTEDGSRIDAHYKGPFGDQTP